MRSVATASRFHQFRPKSRFARLAPLLILLAVPSLVGCGQSDPPQVAVFPVTGKVKLVGGEVPASARLVFHAVTRSEALPPGVAPSAIVDKDGSFKVGTYGTGDGAPPGEYKVTVEWYKLVVTPEETYSGPNVLPAVYASSTTTPITVSVQSGPTELSPIEIDPKKK